MEDFFEDYETQGLPGGPNELKRFTNGFIISERGQWDYPGQPTAVPTPTGEITMQGVEDDLVGIDNLGNMQYMTPGNDYQFEGDMVYEIPQAKKGGSKKPSKKYSRSLMAKNRLFAKNPLFKKSKSVKNKIFDPYSPYFQEGGALEIELDENEIEEYRRGGYVVEDISVPSLTKASYGYSVGNLIRKQNGGQPLPDDIKNHPFVKKTDPNKDDTYENVFEIFDPSGLSSWDDVSRSYSKNGLDGETIIEVLGALPIIGKIGKGASKIIKGARQGLPLTAKQIRNLKNSERILKYSPKALKGYDAAQAYSEEQVPVRKPVIKPEVTVRPKKQEGGSISGTQGLTDDFSQRLTQFILDARSQGVDLGVGSGYRSYEKQEKLWKQALKKYGSPEKARKWVAPPGGSFHNKGLAVDLNSNGQFLGKDANNKATEWAHANAKKYGLHFRMGHEPWHIEPIEKTKSSSDKEKEHDHMHADTYGDAPQVTADDQLAQTLKVKELELEQKQKQIAEQQKAMHDDDYSNWTPPKEEVVVDPKDEQLNALAKIMATSNQNLFEQYSANLQNQMKDGGFVMELTDEEIKRYRKGGYIIEELD
jgi:LAS superfamily LD-carboxypeptidase LdcB